MEHFYSRASCEARLIAPIKFEYGANFYSRASCEARLELANRLSGDTEEDIKKDAEALKAVVGNVTVQRTQFSSGDGDKDDTKAALKSMLQNLKGE